MNLADFDYSLPEELIAQRPLEDRAASRMLVLHRREQRWEDRLFREFPQFAGPGDCLVLNDSKVFPCRLYGRREDLSGRVEVLLLRPEPDRPNVWKALVRPGRKMPVGEVIRFDGELEAEIISRSEFGERTLRFSSHPDLFAKIDEIGHMPLPPYIKRADQTEDRQRYQTVFAREPGSAAAPTAGLHFTPEILEQCRTAGAQIAFVTLHVGLGTFQPLRDSVRLHSEVFSISEENAAKMRSAKRLIAIGTTSVRAIETSLRSGEIRATQSETDLLIAPGFDFRGTGALLTNFHLPRSSLLLLVSAFAGRAQILAAYRHAVEQRYRFYSYGDCMLVI